MSHSGPMTNDDNAEIQRYINSRRMSSNLLYHNVVSKTKGVFEHRRT